MTLPGWDKTLDCVHFLQSSSSRTFQLSNTLSIRYTNEEYFWWPLFLLFNFRISDNNWGFVAARQLNNQYQTSWIFDTIVVICLLKVFDPFLRHKKGSWTRSKLFESFLKVFRMFMFPFSMFNKYNVKRSFNSPRQSVDQRFL